MDLAEIQRRRELIQTVEATFLDFKINAHKLYPLANCLSSSRGGNKSYNYCPLMLSMVTCTQLTFPRCLFYSFHSKTQDKLRPKKKKKLNESRTYWYLQIAVKNLEAMS